jgi:signal transduction histidine kinase
VTPPDPGPAPSGETRDSPALAAAVLAAASGSQLEATLHDIVHAAVRHVGAGYGAMGVLTPDGRRLDRFVIVATDGDDHEPAGRLPEDQPILRLLVPDATPPPPRGAGTLPPSPGAAVGDPAPRPFLGVPVRVRDAVFGNLYLTEKRSDGPFTRADEEVAEALAAVAGLAIENARLAEHAETRRRWGQAATELATALLSGADPDQVLRSVAIRVSALTRSDMVGVLAPSRDDKETMTIVAAVGVAADEVEGVKVPLEGTYVGATYAAGRPRIIEDVSSMPVVGRRAATVVELTAGFGPALIVSLGSPPSRSLLVAMRASGREPFDTDDLDLLSAFAAQAAVTLELARAQQREHRLQVQADRDRIARDLHDHVVQRIFATALSLDRLGRSLEAEHGEIAIRLSRSVDDLHGTISRIRTSIFELHESEDASSAAVRRRLVEVVRSVTEGHEVRPDLRIRCERDDLPPDMVLDLVAVVRELVTNVVRHAQARRMTVTVDIAEEVRVGVTDDGVGLPPITVRSGLANLADRAERRGGRLTCMAAVSGTEIQWVVPAAR